MEELGDQSKVVFARVSTSGISWKIGWGRGRGGAASNPLPFHTNTH
jgi:hypothetical protein